MSEEDFNANDIKKNCEVYVNGAGTFPLNYYFTDDKEVYNNRYTEPSNFYPEMTPTIQTTGDYVVNSKNAGIYYFNTGFTYVLYTMLKFKFPHLKIKEDLIGKVEICFPQNLPSIMIKKATLHLGSTISMTYNSHNLDAMNQWFRTNKIMGYDNWLKLKNGSHINYCKWSNEISEKDIDIFIPFDCFRDPKNPNCGLPILYFREADKKSCYENIYYERNLNNLLRVRYRTETNEKDEKDKKYSEWTECLLGKCPIKNIFEESPEMELDDPTHWVKYSMMIEQAEKNLYKRYKDYRNPFDMKTFYTDCSVATSEKVILNDDEQNIKIPIDSKWPIKFVVITAVSLDSVSKGNSLYYLTEKGHNPLKNVKIEINGRKALSYSFNVSDSMEPPNGVTSMPYVEGSHYIGFGQNSMENEKAFGISGNFNFDITLNSKHKNEKEQKFTIYISYFFVRFFRYALELDKKEIEKGNLDEYLINGMKIIDEPGDIIPKIPTKPM